MDMMALFDTDLAVNPDAIAPSAPAPAVVPPVVTAGPVLGETVLAVDGNSIAHRAYHAYGARPDVTNPVGAGLYGFLALLAAVVDMVAPASTIIGFDCRKTSFRKDIFPDYKGQRPDKPDALDALLDEIPVALAELGAAVVSEEGYEADDICGSVAGSARTAGRRCVVATSDRDAFSLVGGGVEVLRIRSGMHRAQQYTSRRFKRELGIKPGQYTEYAALRGDASDNLPGIYGIGPKKARDLLGRFDRVADAVADPLGCRSVLGREVGQVLLDDHAAPDSVFHRNIQLMTIVQDLDIDLDAGLPATPPDVIDEKLRDRKLAGLIGRMTLCFGDTGQSSQAPPLTDADVPSLDIE